MATRPMWELIGYSTERYTDIRYLDYTTSERKARLFGQIEKIQFTDSGHGIVFAARRIASRNERKPIFTGPGSCRDHVERELKRLSEATYSRERRVST